MKRENPYNTKLGVKGIMREMFTDKPEEYLTPEQVDEEEFQANADEYRQMEEDEKILDPIDAGSERAEKELDEARQTLTNLQIGCVVLSFLMQIGGFFVPVWWVYCLGNIIGCALAVVYVTWMYKTIERALELDPGSAWKVARKQAMLRYFTVFVVLVLVCLIGDEWMALGAVLSTLSIKFSVYLQSLTNRIRKIISKGR